MLDGGIKARDIALVDVSKRWGDTVGLADVSVEIKAGEFTALLGPSGCGKSTLLRLIAGLESASDGQIFIGGQDVTRAVPDKRGLAMVFQSYALFPHLSVAENIIFGLRTRRVARADRDERLRHVADMLGLTPYLDRKPSALSGGQQQRVALGRAVIANRPVCLMDEPLSNLDAKLRHEMRVELRALQQKIGFTMVYVTHDQSEAMTMADRIVLLNAGGVEQIATPRALYERPATRFAAQFIGTPPMNILSGAGFAHRHPVDEGVVLGIRPEDISICATGAAATVQTVEYFGADTVIGCRVGGDHVVLRAGAGQSIAVGDTVHLDCAARAVHRFDARTGARL